jgi:hypothetical protein
MATVLAGIGNLVGGGLFQGISGLINTIRGKSPEDAAKLAELAAKYQEDVLAADNAARQAQTDVNKVEAASSSMFVAGWRPFIGWVCGTGLSSSVSSQPAFHLGRGAVSSPVRVPFAGPGNPDDSAVRHAWLRRDADLRKSQRRQFRTLMRYVKAQCYSARCAEANSQQERWDETFGCYRPY